MVQERAGRPSSSIPSVMAAAAAWASLLHGKEIDRCVRLWKSSMPAQIRS